MNPQTGSWTFRVRVRGLGLGAGLGLTADKKPEPGISDLVWFGGWVPRVMVEGCIGAEA